MNSIVEAKLKKLEEQREEVIALTDAAGDAADIMSEFGRNDRDEVAFESSGLCANFHVQQFSAMTPILREFASRGHHLIGSPMDCFPVNGRMWLCGSIHVWAMIVPKDGVTACKRVQTGVEEQPVYEWQCEPAEEVTA